MSRVQFGTLTEAKKDFADTRIRLTPGKESVKGTIDAWRSVGQPEQDGEDIDKYQKHIGTQADEMRSGMRNLLHDIEVSFKEALNELGIDDYTVRTLGWKNTPQIRAINNDIQVAVSATLSYRGPDLDDAAQQTIEDWLSDDLPRSYGPVTVWWGR